MSEFKNKKLQKISSLLMECNLEGQITEEDCLKKIQKLVTRKRPKRRISKKLNVLRKMPSLYHKLPDENFDLEKSEVVKWIITKPEIQEWIYQVAKDNHLIKYDKETGKWHGVKEGDQK